VDNSTTAVLRHTDRTLTSATGSLLLERLATRTGNFSAVLDLVRALASGSEMSNNDLVNERHIGHNIEHRAGELYCAGLLTSGVNDGYLRHSP
jgi:hypothetical protein